MLSGSGWINASSEHVKYHREGRSSLPPETRPRRSVPGRHTIPLSALKSVDRLRPSATPRRLFLDPATTTLSPKSRAWVLPHQHGNLRRLDLRQKIAVQVRVPAELTPAHLTHVIPTGVL